MIKIPGKRLSLDQILNHDFFMKGIIPSSLEIIQMMQKTDYSGIEIIDIKGPEIYIVKFLDYTSKYGIGYILSNGFCGVHFNDRTNIILNPNSDIFYYEEQKIINCYNLNNYPSHLQKKIILLKHFKDYLLKENENIISTNKFNENDDKNWPYTYASEWKKIDDVNIFRLTNEIIQIIFKDKSEVILCINKKLLVYKDKKNSRSVCFLPNVSESSNKDFIEKVEYSRKLLVEILKKAQENKRVIEDIALNHKSKQLKSFNSSENISDAEKINIKFTSIDQSIIDLSIICKITDRFITIKNEILNNYPKLKEKNIYFLANGGIIDELKTLKENNIKKDTVILIAEECSFYI